jgi:hypothetical protein
MALLPSKNQVGLYVDADTITVVNGDAAGAQINVAGFAELKGAVSLEGDADAKQKALDLIKTALNRAGVKSKNIMISVPGDASMTRHFELPVLPKKEERQAVRFEAQKYLPFDVKNLYYDYEVYLNPENGKNRVVYYACKKTTVDTLSAMLTLSGMKIAQVELVSHSIARAFNRRASKTADEVSLVMTSNGPDTAELVIQKQGSVITTRHIPLQKTAEGSLDVPLLVSDVRISIDYFSENFKDMKLQRVFVVTPFAGDTQTLCRALSKELSIPADSGSLFEPPAAAVSTSAAVAVYGLTLASLEKRGTKRISLKPTEQQTVAPLVTWEEEKKQLQDLATKEIIGLAIVFAAVFFVLGGMAGKKDKELQMAIENHPKAKSATLADSLSALQDKESKMTQKVAFFNSLDKQRVYFTIKMNEMAKTVPANVRLAEWTYQDELTQQGVSDVVMRIDGYVLSAEGSSELSVVNKFVAQLSQNTEFMLGLTEIRIARTSKALVDERSVTKFSLECSRKQP